jgi:hypothetical protein
MKHIGICSRKRKENLKSLVPEPGKYRQDAVQLVSRRRPIDLSIG